MTMEFIAGRALRPTAKRLPEHGRSHNLSLVLQTLYSEGTRSRADIARATGLTRVTVSDLVAELIADSLIVEVGMSEDVRPGKPSTLLDINRGAFQIIGIDLSAFERFRGAVLDLEGNLLAIADIPLDSCTGAEAVAKVESLIAELLQKTTAPLLGIGIGSPGIVDFDGIVLSAPNLGWERVALQSLISERFGKPVVVANDANVATLAEHSFGGAHADMMLIRIGHGVGAGLLLGGHLLLGSRFASGEIGHVVVGTDGGELCVCGKSGCLETWLAAPRLDAKIAGRTDAERQTILAEAGDRLGIVMSAIVGALNISEIILSGPPHLLEGTFESATINSIRLRTMAEFHDNLIVRMTTLGEDIVIRGAGSMVLSRELGVS